MISAKFSILYTPSKENSFHKQWQNKYTSIPTNTREFISSRPEIELSTDEVFRQKENYTRWKHGNAEGMKNNGM